VELELYVHTIFSLLDLLQRWQQDTKKAVDAARATSGGSGSKSGGGSSISAGSRHGGAGGDADDASLAAAAAALQRVGAFLQRIPEVTLAHAASK